MLVSISLIFIIAFGSIVGCEDYKSSIFKAIGLKNIEHLPNPVISFFDKVAIITTVATPMEIGMSAMVQMRTG